MSLIDQNGYEIDLSLYQELKYSPDEIDCRGIRTAILQAFSQGDRQPILDFISNNCAGCGGPDAVIVDNHANDYIPGGIWVRKDSACILSTDSD